MLNTHLANVYEFARIYVWMAFSKINIVSQESLSTSVINAVEVLLLANALTNVYKHYHKTCSCMLGMVSIASVTVF